MNLYSLVFNNLFSYIFCILVSLRIYVKILSIFVINLTSYHFHRRSFTWYMAFLLIIYLVLSYKAKVNSEMLSLETHLGILTRSIRIHQYKYLQYYRKLIQIKLIVMMKAIEMIEL